MGATLTEALLAPSTIRLFGRPFTGLEIRELGLGTSSNNPLVARLKQAADSKATAEKVKAAKIAAAKTADQKAAAETGKLEMPDAEVFGLARIYGFSYLGNYFKLTAPPVLLVWGEGDPMPPGI
ncbi:MAG TPA: hypothetical protein VJK90_11790, partial [Acetobacteraceae bacterium]|nr:hypothetical protein [Acetobacteraceae bacterium]